MPQLCKYWIAATLALLLVQQVSCIDQSCIAKSNEYVGSKKAPTQSDFELLIQDSINDEMKLRVISGCYNILGIMTSLQLTLKSQISEQVSLSYIGQRGMGDTCTSLELAYDERITILEISYNGVTIEAGATMTTKGQFQRWGDMTETVKQWIFTEKHELIGIFGTSADRGISNLGVIVYKAGDCTNAVDEIDLEDEQADDLANQFDQQSEPEPQPEAVRRPQSQESLNQRGELQRTGTTTLVDKLIIQEGQQLERMIWMLALILFLLMMLLIVIICTICAWRRPKDQITRVQERERQQIEQIAQRIYVQEEKPGSLNLVDVANLDTQNDQIDTVRQLKEQGFSSPDGKASGRNEGANLDLRPFSVEQETRQTRMEEDHV